MTDTARRVDWTDSIAEFCDKLDVLEFLGYGREPALLELVKHIGARLQVLSLPGRFTAYGEIVQLCPRSMIDAYVEFEYCDVLEAIGGRLRKLATASPALGFGMPQPAGELGKTLTKLEQFDVLVKEHEATAQYLTSLFITPKPHLREMVFRADYFMRSMADIFSAVADVVRTLEVLRFIDMKVIAADIEMLVVANPRLRNVEVVFRDCTFPNALVPSFHGADEMLEEWEERRRASDRAALIDTILTNTEQVRPSSRNPGQPARVFFFFFVFRFFLLRM